MRLDQPTGSRQGLGQGQRTFGHSRQRLPLLRGAELVTQGEQRLVGALDFAVERASRGEQILHAQGSTRLLESRRALVAHQGDPALGPGLVGQLFEAESILGSELGRDLAAQHRGKSLSDRHGEHQAPTRAPWEKGRS